VSSGPVRIGVDTGGTFTDVVAIHQGASRVVATKVPSTPADPSRAFLAGVAKALGLLGLAGPDVESVSHGTTVATNKLLTGELGPLGLVTTEGYRFILEIARQSVPDGYGNSYFWVKPPRLVPPDRVQVVGGRMDAEGREIRPFHRAQAVRAARWFRQQGIGAVGVCFLHSYANPAHELAMKEVLSTEHPSCVVSLSSEVLGEYREYERAVTTLLDAAVKASVGRYVLLVKEGLGGLTGPGGTSGASGEAPLFVMKSNGGVASPEEVAALPITTVMSGPAAGALGAALIAGRAGYERVLTCDGGGTSTDVAVVLGGEPTLTTEGSVGPFPSRIPMVDVVSVGAGGGSVAWASPEGTLKVGPASAGAEPGPLCYGKGGTEPTVTDAHLFLGRIPSHLLGGELALDVAASRAGIGKLAAGLSLSPEDCARGVLEVAAWNQANALRRVTVQRGLDLRDLALTVFGGSGPLLACRLVELLGLPLALVPPDPGNVSALGLLSVDVRHDYVRTHVCSEDRLDPSRVESVYQDLERKARATLAREGFSSGSLVRSADLRYGGQAFEVRVPVGPGPLTAAGAEEVVEAFHDAHQRLYGYCFRSQPTQRVEWVNLRVSGIGPLPRPPIPVVAPGGGGVERACTGTRRVHFDAWMDTPVYRREGLAPGDVLEGPAVVEEHGSTLPLAPGFRARVDPWGNLVLAPGRLPPAPAAGGADPVLVEVVEGTLASVEKEVEVAVGRTARSPMIRDAHDYRAGIHDRHLRKLTGRSYSALVQPVVRDFPLESMRPGDVYFHNDVYLSEGGIGHLPDLCVTVPVFHGGEVVAFVQVFGHHDDIGGTVPGSMPSRARSVFEEGLMVPPIKLWDRGVPNRAALRIMTRNSRMPESLAADLDAECAACLMGARRLAELFDRYGVGPVQACFDAIVDKTTETFRREVLAKIPEGTYVWEDYAEHDGVDPPRLHRQRLTLTKEPDRLVLDFNGTSPQAKGPINHCGDAAGGNFLKKWLAPVLRNLADSPERAAQLDVNEGVVPLMEIRFPPPGTLLTPVFPAPTNARTFVILRLLGVLAGALAKAVGGRMPADQETIRYTGLYGLDGQGRPYLMREVLGGGSGGRYYGDGEDTIHIVPDSKNLPVEFCESRFPLIVEELGLAVDSGGPGQYRGGLGYDKRIRMLADACFMSVADRSILSCWGLGGGRAGQPFRVTVDPGGPGERDLEGLVDEEPVRSGETIRIRTTGGGGWGDPFLRDPRDVERDVLWGKVSVEGAARDYGVVLVQGRVDPEATEALRARLRSERGAQPFFDRGPGYARLAGGDPWAEVDWL